MVFAAVSARVLGVVARAGLPDSVRVSNGMLTMNQLVPLIVTTRAGVVVVRVSEFPVKVKETVERSGAGDAGVTWP